MLASPSPVAHVAPHGDQNFLDFIRLSLENLAKSYVSDPHPEAGATPTENPRYSGNSSLHPKRFNS